MSLKKRLDKYFYPEYGDKWTAGVYHRFVVEKLSPSDSLLDYGAGRGAHPLHGFHGEVARTVGVDIDEAVLENPALDLAHVISPYGAIPYPDSTFDVVVSAYVMEHVEDPARVFAEVWRVLRPGGAFLFMTPNRRHYVPVVASLTPHWFHLWVNRRRGNPDHDTFPTVYRANTPAAIRRLARQSGFNVDEIRMIEGRPEYLRAFTPLYPLGILYERAVNSLPMLASLRVVMLVALRKPAALGGHPKPATDGHLKTGHHR